MHGMTLRLTRYRSLITPATSVKNKTHPLDMMVMVVSIVTTKESEA